MDLPGQDGSAPAAGTNGSTAPAPAVVANGPEVHSPPLQADAQPHVEAPPASAPKPNGRKRRRGRTKGMNKLVAHARGLVLEAQAVNYNMLRDKLGVSLDTVTKVLKSLDRAGVTVKLKDRTRMVLLGPDGKKKAAASADRARSAKKARAKPVATPYAATSLSTAEQIKFCNELAQAFRASKTAASVKTADALSGIARKLAEAPKAVNPALSKFT